MASGFPVGTPVQNLVTTVVNPNGAQNSDGAVATVSGGRHGDAMVSELHGKRYIAASRGNLIVGTTGAVTLNVYTSTAPTAVLYNPVGSGKLIEVHRIVASVLVATTVVNALVLASPAFGANPTSVTAGTYMQMPLGGATSGHVGVVANVATIAAPAAPFIGLGISNTLVTGTTEVTGAFFEFDGMMVLAPGSTLVVGTSTTVEGSGNYSIDFWFSEWLP